MRSLAGKLTLAFLLVGLTGSLIVAVIIGRRATAAFNQFILTREQQAMVNVLVKYYESRGSWDGVDQVIPLLGDSVLRNLEGRREFNRAWGRFVLVGPDRKIAFSLLPGQVGQAVARRELERAVALQSGSQTIGWLLLSSTPRRWIQDSPEWKFLRTINLAILFGALAATVLALVLGRLLAVTMTRSLRELKEATLEIARGKLGKQVKVRTNDEVGELAASFNRMSSDLERAIQVRRQMTADIAHDLRSPLSVIAGYAEALSDGKLSGTPEIYGILYQEARRLSRLVEDLRILSLADAGELPLLRQEIQPLELLRRAVSRHAVTAGQKGVSLKVAPGPELPLVSVDVERMAQVFDNLVVNAFRYTPPGGEIVLSAGIEDGRVKLQVRDSGSGISPEDLPYIFDRFYRGDKARIQNGESGLGLAIARSIVEAHGGEIRVESPPGHGATFTISLKTA